MVVQDAVDAARRVVETRVSTDRPTSCTSAFGALEGAAGFAVIVYAFVASQHAETVMGRRGGSSIRNAVPCPPTTLLRTLRQRMC